MVLFNQDPILPEIENRTDMDIELPPSAVAILRVTYESLFFQQKLPYKDRRKVWKKYKRKKARIINHFAILKLQHDSSHEPDHPNDDEQCSDLPKGPLTNSAIIHYMKSLEPHKNTEVVGILQNQIRAPENIACYEVEPATQVVESRHDSNELFISTETDTNIALNEDATRPTHETDEITRLLAELDDDVEQWQNPSPPADYQAPVKGNEIIVELSEGPAIDLASSDILNDNRPLCSFYLKTGACRFGIRCSKKHESISSSDTLVFLNMFNTFLFDLEDRLRISGDVHDLSLEHSEQDLYKEFAEFYFEIQPEFRDIGRLNHLYVCRNRCHHLRGNVYVQYLSKKDAKACFDKMCGRYFGGKPLVCSYVNISSWAGTLCGIDARTGKCSRGGQCNYLHIFRTPNSKKYRYSHYGNRDHSPHSHRTKKPDIVQSSSRRLKSKASKRSLNRHDRSSKKDYKNAHRHSKNKHVHSRSRSPSSGLESDTVQNRKWHKSSKLSNTTLKNTKYSSSDDWHSSAESGKSDHNSYQESKRQKKLKKKKKKHKKKD